MIDRIVKLIQSIEAKADQETIIVFKGFRYREISSLQNKFFLDASRIVDDNNIVEFEKNMIYSLSKNINEPNKVFWMTYEEFIMAYDVVQHNFKIKIIQNNLYNKRYPYDGTLKDVEETYKKFFYNVEDEICEYDQNEYDGITKFYGDIAYSKNTGTYYVTYNSEIESKSSAEILNFYSSFTKKIPQKNFEGNSYTLELGDDEIPFLDLIYYLHSDELLARHIQLVSMVNLEDLPNMYLERINILQILFEGSKEFSFTLKSIEREAILNEDRYIEILKRYWGFDSFRNLKMYKDIRRAEKDIIEISQAQIIDDIVKQSSIALESGEANYRDIFITSATGSGKSIMFQIPAIYLSEKFEEQKPLTIVVSPLIALMNDQVEAIRSKGGDFAETINSNTLPYERDEILKKIENGKCKILYLSPETLLARSDVKTLISNRRLGLLIVDEAHIVTTWGKSFRADYWYLGIFLQKLRKQYDFPIVTFTATAIYGGPEDMYLDTRDSLNMINPISYFGNVRREDIKLLISSPSSDEFKDCSSHEYQMIKSQLALRHLELADNYNQKSLVYFPTVQNLNMFNSFLKLNNSDIYNKTACYHGKMKKEDRDEVLNSFRKGDVQFVLATKAFGMGVDIPDITNVYHYAPSGSVTDYIQEIGRVARDKSLVKNGFAWCDFLPKDFNEIKKLYGLSSIKKSQLIEVMKKIVNIYEEKGNKRNLILSADDFKTIFMQDNNDTSDFDNKIKRALLLIEKDFSAPNKLGYPPFVARPRSLFGQENIFMNKDILNCVENSDIKRFLHKKYQIHGEKYDAIYTLELSKLWEKYYRDYSYPNFKRMLFTKEERKKLKHSNIFEKFVYTTGINVSISQGNINDVVRSFNKYLEVYSDFLASRKRSGKYFNVREVGDFLKSKISHLDSFKSRAIGHALVNSCFEYQSIINRNFISQILSANKDPSFKISGNYDSFITATKNGFRKFLKDKNNYCSNEDELIKFYYRNSSSLKEDSFIIGLAESMELLSFTIENGSSPEIYIRVNSIYPMIKAIKEGNYYKNQLLHEIYMKHIISVEMLTYLFNKKFKGNSVTEQVKKYSEFFWDSIEDYFLGSLPSEVEDKIYKEKGYFYSKAWHYNL